MLRMITSQCFSLFCNSQLLCSDKTIELKTSYTYSVICKGRFFPCRQMGHNFLVLTKPVSFSKSTAPSCAPHSFDFLPAVPTNNECFSHRWSCIWLLILSVTSWGTKYRAFTKVKLMPLRKVLVQRKNWYLSS